MHKRSLAGLLALTVTLTIAASLLAGRTFPARAAAPGLESIPAFGHVFVLIGENTSYVEVTPQRAPYLTQTFKPQAAWLTQYSALHSGSLSDYIGMTSGQYLP